MILKTSNQKFCEELNNFYEFKEDKIQEWSEVLYKDWSQKYSTNYIMNIYEDWKLSINPVECYHGGHLVRVNEYLRTGKDNDLIETYNKMIKHLDNTFTSCPMIDRDIILYRLIKENDFNDIKKCNKFPYMDKGYLSTSLTKNICKLVYPNITYSDREHLLKLYVSKNSRAIFTGYFEIAIKEENEIILPRNGFLMPIKNPYFDIEVGKTILECIYKY